ncbi:hypothetical protein AMS68_007819 [Peltaster fructicola]|uniref:Uncharacterized protein n=1 Tax=Peltaster fructicola TaxID=286661 RepID=A0A6H0Y5I2_9PEZI|nr:hypothetical protein AMS68_007819 [Peltaster fructicola]
MPFSPERSLLRVEVPALHTIDTTSVENLFGMWSVFSKTSHAMEDGKRLENLSWRLWNRETFCCARPTTTTKAPRQRQRGSTNVTSAIATPRTATTDIPVPELSSSLESASSESIVEDDQSLIDDDASTHLDKSRGHEKHITPIDLEKIVISITETKDPKSMELPKSILSVAETEEAVTPHPSSSHATLLESSASTVRTEESKSTIASDESSSTEMSGHSIIRGFVPGGAPSSYRSQTHLPIAQPRAILKTSAHYSQSPAKKKGAMFTIGTSSGEDESSLDSHMRMPSIQSELSESLRREGRSGLKKTTSFSDKVTIARAAAARHSPVFESDDEDEEVSESAIEDDDDSSEWEDSDDNNSGPSSMDGTLFQRVDSRPNLTSRRSLLTTLMHEPDRAKALASAASRSTPAMRRSRAASPNGPSLATTPEESVEVTGTRPQPIIMTTSNTHQQLALSPRTTRRNMLSTELTESLRKNLLWERQHKSTGNLSALKRRHTSQNIKDLKEHPQPTYPTKTGTNMSFNNDYFNAGLGEYHTKGW